MALKYNKATDSEHEVTLDSSLIYAGWRAGTAPAGSAVGVEVRTTFVGNGASIKISGKAEGGSAPGSISGKMKNNVFVGELDIPEDAEIGDMVYFEAKLSGLGLSGESDRIPVVPPIKVANMKWSASEARRGDVLTLSADITGCRNDTDAMVIIYEYDADGAHDKIAEVPAKINNDKLELKWEYEYHEDTDEIPTQEEHDKYGGTYNPPEYYFVIDIAGQKFGVEQESGLLTFKDWIEIKLLSYTGKEKYVLHLPDGSSREGEFDDEGVLHEENIIPGRFHVEIKQEEQDSGSGE